MNKFARASRLFSLWGLFPCVAALVVAIVTGILRRMAGGMVGESAPGDGHRWAGHILVIMFWLLLIVMVAWAIAAFAQKRWLRALLGLGSALLAVAAVFLCAFSGYLPPAHDIDGARARIVIIHFVVAPFFALAATAALWFVLQVPDLE